MNSFTITGRIGRLEAKTSQAGRTYYRIEIDDEGGNGGGYGSREAPPRIPLTVFRDIGDIREGDSVIITGRIAGNARGQYLNLDAKDIEIALKPSAQQARQPPQPPAQQCRHEYDKPEYAPPPRQSNPPPQQYGNPSDVIRSVAQATVSPDAGRRFEKDDDGEVIPF
jgi:hypothetical protein